MKLIYSEDFKLKLHTKHFPLVGFWYCRLTLDSSVKPGAVNPNGYLSNFYDNNYPESCPYSNRLEWLSNPSDDKPGVLYHSNLHKISMSEMHKAKVLIQDNDFKLSITLPEELRKNSESNYMYTLYALDLLKYPNGDVTVNGEYDSQESYKRDINNISAILVFKPGDLRENDLIKSVTNIFDLEEEPKCSFRNSLLEGSNQDEITHYVHGEIDRDTLFESWKDSTKFIESDSGYERARALLGTDKPSDLQGHMTIGTNGVIHL